MKKEIKNTINSQDKYNRKVRRFRVKKQNKTKSGRKKWKR